MASSSEPSARAWYRDGLRFECTRSGRCCTNRGESRYVFVDEAEQAALAEHLGLERADFRARYCETVEDETSLVSRDDACVFLTPQRECAVHPARPRQCRTWPFWPETLRSRKVWRREVESFCPGAGRGPLHDAAAIERAARESEGQPDGAARPPQRPR